MTRITVDDVLRTRLLDLSSPLELCDVEGRVLAHLVPVESAAFVPAEPQISREELQRRAESSERRYSTAEVLERLESL